MVKSFQISKEQSCFLDIVRAISSQMVVVGHYFAFFYPGQIIGTTIPFQNFGVVIFFVLSGYLIAMSTLNARQRGGTYFEFLINRFSRIYVTFVPGLIFVALIDFFVFESTLYKHGHAYNPLMFVMNLFMLQDYPLWPIVGKLFSQFKNITSFGSGRPLWTLAVEWWMYLWFGYLVLGSLKLNRVNFKNLMITGFLSVVPMYHMILGRGNALTWIWLLGCGVLLLTTLLYRYQIDKWILLLLACLFLGLMGMRFLIVKTFYDLQGALFFAGAFGALLLMVKQFCFSKRIPRSVNYLINVAAGSSYALYIVHYSIAEAMLIRYGNQDPVFNFVICWILAQIVAVAIYLIFDQRHKGVAEFIKGFFVGKSSAGAQSHTGQA